MKTATYPVITATMLALIAAVLWFAPPASAQQLPEVRFEIINKSVAEPTTGPDGTTSTEEITLLLSEESSQTVTVRLTFRDISAEAGKDYSVADQTVTFRPGVTSVKIPITIIRSVNGENTERFFMYLSNPVNATIPNSQAQMTILDQDIYEMWHEPGNAVEGGLLPVTIHLSGQYDFDFTVVIKTRTNSNAQQGQDYVEYSETVFMQPLQTESTIYIQTVDDDVAEPPEAVAFDMLRNNAPVIMRDEIDQIGWILDDDRTSYPRRGQMNVSSSYQLNSRIQGRALLSKEVGAITRVNVWLNRPPTKPVTVTATISGHPNLEIARTKRTHTFTPENWAPFTYPIHQHSNDEGVVVDTATLTYTVVTDDPQYRRYRTKLKPTTIIEHESFAQPKGRKTLSQEHTGLTGDLSVALNERTTSRHDGTAYWVILDFSEPIKTKESTFRNSLEARGAYIGRTIALPTGRRHWAVELRPFNATDVSHLTVKGNRDCGEPGAICTRGGDKLKNTFIVSIAPPGVDAHLPPGIGRIPLISADDQSFDEDVGTVTVDIELNKTTGHDVTFDYTTATQRRTGHATEQEDYRGKSGSVTIPAGQTTHSVVITILDDAEAEPDEEFILFLHNLDGAEFPGDPRFNSNFSARLTITDDD